MQQKSQEVELTIDGFPCRTYVASPVVPGRYPGILLYSDIFQLAGPTIRMVRRLAGHGFVVAAPELYFRKTLPGLVVNADDIGRMSGNYLAKSTAVSDYDLITNAVFSHLSQRPDVIQGALGTMGFCIGGHLSLRAALDPRCKTAVCCYPTGVHNGKLGKDADAGTLARLAEIKGNLLVVFGSVDPHVPPEGRKAITDGLSNAKVNHRVIVAEGEHAFMRDEGPRYDASATDAIYGEAIALFSKLKS